MFREFIFLKSDLDKIYSENKLKGILYRKKYLGQIQKMLNNLQGQSIDTNLLRSFYEFLKLTRIHLDEKYKEKYLVSLYSDYNSIHIIVNSDINFTVTIFMENRILIKYCNSNIRFEYEIKESFSNIDTRDKEKYNIIMEVADKLSEIIKFSVMSYFKKGN